jgi:alkanesulfonate monooxygenase SsuD/methylene tetrahydromethanopterin reductase-like flavin-dependent oxidoreductase (luciferase family)
VVHAGRVLGADVTAGRRGIALTPMETRLDVIVRMAELAEELGYEVFAVPEGWGLDSTVVLAEIAMRTRRIELAAGVLSVWGRSAGTIAMGAATLQRLSRGRFVLGLGASTRQLAEGFHGAGYVRPAERLRQVATTVRALLDGERAGGVPGSRSLRLGLPAAPEIPLWIAATGPRTVRTAAELADGWYPIFLTRERCRTWAAELRAVRERSGLRDRPLTVAAGPLAVADQDVGRARAAAAACTAWYLTAMGDGYARLVSEQGYAGEVADVVAANPRPGPQSGVVPESAQVLLDELTVYGPPASVGERLEAWDAVADVVMVGLPPGLPWPCVEATMRAAAVG